MKFRLLPSLNHDSCHAAQPIEPRFNVIGRQLPQVRLWNLVRRQAVANDWKTGEVHPVRFDFGGRGKAALDTRHCGIHQLQGFDHVHVPVEEQIDIGGAPARDGTNRLQPGDDVDGLLDGPRDGHFHLLDGHNAVIHTDFDKRKVRRRKYGHRKLECLVNSDNAEDDDQENDRFRVPVKPIIFGMLGGVQYYRVTRPHALLVLFFFLWRLDLNFRFGEDVLFKFRELKCANRHDAFSALETFGYLHISAVANTDHDGLLARFIFRVDDHDRGVSRRARQDGGLGNDERAGDGLRYHLSAQTRTRLQIGR